MSSVSLTRQYDTLLSLTLDNYRPTLVDQIHKGIPYLWWLENRAKGVGIRMASGGAKIKIQIVNAKNGNARSFDKYDTITPSATEEITSAFDDWRAIASTIQISWTEMLDNSGDEQILDMLRAKINVCEMSFREEINRQLVAGIVGVTGTNPTRRFEPGSAGGGSAGRDLNPLGFLIQKDFGAASPLVESLDQNTETYWQNKWATATGPSAASTYAGFKQEMEHLYNNCGKGGTNDTPDLIISDQNYFELYAASLVSQQRFASYSDEGATSANFQSLLFKNAVMMWDEYMPSYGDTATDTVSLTQNAANACAFFVNSAWVEFVINRRGNFVLTEFQEPIGQAAIFAKMLLRAQHITTQRRKLGLHYGVNASGITS